MRSRARALFATLACSRLLLATAGVGAAELLPKGVIEDGSNPDFGFAAPTGIAVSPGGQSLYVAGFGEDAIEVFRRDVVSGAVAHLGSLRDGVNGVDGLGGVLSIIVSADGRNLYAVGVIDQSVVVFDRDRVTGWLTFAGQLRNGVGGVAGLADPRSIVASSDGLFLYAACESAVVVFARDAETGSLAFVQAVPLSPGSGAQGIAVSPDDFNLYVGGYTFSELRIYARDIKTGRLRLLDVMANGRDGVSGLAGIDSVVVSSDRRSVYANGTLDSSLVHFARDPRTGLLDFVALHTDGQQGVDGLGFSAGMSIGGVLDSRVYAGGADGSIAVFERSSLDGALSFATAFPIPGSSFTGSGQQILAFGGHLYLLNGIDDRLSLFSIAALRYVETERDGVAGANGLGGAEALAMTPNGGHLYVTGDTDHAVTVFQVDRSTGALAASSVVTDGVNGVDGIAAPRGIAVSRDARHVYVAGLSDSAIAAFARDPSTGALSFLEFETQGRNGVDEMLGPRTVVLSPDGRHLYTAAFVSDAVVWFTRNDATGDLSFGGFLKDGVAGVDGLDGAYAVAISGDGRHVYAAGLVDDSVVAFARNAATGALSFVSRAVDGIAGVDGIDGATSVVVSPDGRHVYATGANDNAVAVFSRDATTGALGFVERRRDNEPGTQRLSAPFYAAVSESGDWVLVPSSVENALNVFRRDPVSGRLTLAQLEEDGVDGVTGLLGPSGVVAAPDGFATYVAGSTAGSVVAFTPEPADTAAMLTAIGALVLLGARGRGACPRGTDAPP